MSEVVAVKRGETFVARLIAPPMEDGRWRIDVARPVNGEEWRGSAWFPEGMYEEARRRLEELETDTDVEDLLREWADEQVRDDFEQVVAIADEEQF